MYVNSPKARPTMATITPTSVILVAEKDWEPWIELIKTVSLEYDLWEHINPSTPWAQVPQLTQPIRPTPATVKPPQATATEAPEAPEAPETPEATEATVAPLTETKFSDLDADEKEQLRRLDNEY